MNCCQTIRPTWQDPGPARVVPSNLWPRGATILLYLKALVTPEPSGEAETGSVLPPERLFGAFKASFWALTAVGLGILLALGCN